MEDFSHAGLRTVLPNRTGRRGAHRALDAARDPRAGAHRQPPLQRHPARRPADVLLAAHQAPTPARACGNRGATTAPGRQGQRVPPDAGRGGARTGHRSNGHLERALAETPDLRGDARHRLAHVVDARHRQGRRAARRPHRDPLPLPRGIREAALLLARTPRGGFVSERPRVRRRHHRSQRSEDADRRVDGRPRRGRSAQQHAPSNSKAPELSSALSRSGSDYIRSPPSNIQPAAHESVREVPTSSSASPG